MVQTTSDTAITHQVELPPNWHASDAYTGDDMIDAYFLGKKAGIEAGWGDKIKILANQFKKNIESAMSVSEQVLNEAKEVKIHLKDILLRADSVSKFTAIFIADEKDFASELFLQAHQIAKKYDRDKANNEIYLSFLFMPDSKNTSNDCLEADGYFLRYGKDNERNK